MTYTELEAKCARMEAALKVLKEWREDDDCFCYTDLKCLRCIHVEMAEAALSAASPTRPAPLKFYLLGPNDKVQDGDETVCKRPSVENLALWDGTLTWDKVVSSSIGKPARNFNHCHIRRAVEASPTEPKSDWISVKERMPKTGEYVLIFTGKLRFTAQWVPKFTCNDEFDGDDSEYCAEKDDYYWPEGWYEYSLGEVAYRVGEVTHWMPLPAAPPTDTPPPPATDTAATNL